MDKICGHKIKSKKNRSLCYGRLTSLMSSACSMTSVRPLSCRDDRREGSWNTNTVTTSVAETESERNRVRK